MALLFTASLQPQGPANLAAVRFSAPIRISTIRIFPNGLIFFKNAPHITSKTHPDAFYLDVFFNAQPVVKGARPTNALVPTSISYAGGLMDFAVDMGSEYATRLMILKGDFDHLSLALYGSFVCEPVPVLVYEPKPIVLPKPEPLSSHLHPAHASDPTALAKSLLTLVPNAPSFSLAIRLMFCLKPSEDDWDNPNFPHIYANLDNDSEDYELDSIVHNLDHPIPEDVTQDSLDTFVDRLIDFVGPPSVDQAYQIANVLNLSASQNPSFSQALLNALDLPSIFTTTTLSDPLTLTTLTHACGNALIARHIATQTPLLSTLAEIRQDPRSRSDKNILTALNRLKTRILGWKAFEDALLSASQLENRHNEGGDWSLAAALVYSVFREEQSLGNWLTSMIIHEDILEKLAQTPPADGGDDTHDPPPVFFTKDHLEEEDDKDEDDQLPITHGQFISFVRACIGAASVLGVLAWADSVGNDDCRERTLAVIQLWQGIEGYREIINHLFLLRQMTRRLKWITTDNDPPRHSGLLAERVLCSLILPPVLSTPPHIPLPQSASSSISPQIQSILPALNQDLVQTILSLSQPLAFIPEHDRLCLRKMALVVDDGLPAAIEELVVMFESLASEAASAVGGAVEGEEGGNESGSGRRKPVSLRRVRILRVGVGLILREFEVSGYRDDGYGLTGEGGGGEGQIWDGDMDAFEGGEWKILEAFNTEGTYGFIERLVDLFVDLAEDLTTHFVNYFDFNVNFNAVSPNAVGGGTSSYQQQQLNRELVEQLFATTKELLFLICLLLPAFSLTARGMRKVVGGIVDLVGCSDWVFEIYPLEMDKTTSSLVNGNGKARRSGARRQTDLQCVARKARKACIRVLKKVVEAGEDVVVVEPRRKRCKEEVVLSALLMCGQVNAGGGYKDVVGRIRRILELIEVVLPTSLSSSCDRKEIKLHWATNVFPLVLHDLRLFMRLLPVSLQVNLMHMLIEVDECEDGDVGVVGIGEWLVEEEVKEVREVLAGLMHAGGAGGEEFEFEGDGEGEKTRMEVVEGEGEKMNKLDEEDMKRRREGKRREREIRKAERTINQYRVYTGLEFLWLIASSFETPWLVNALARTPTLSTHITQFFTHFLDGHFVASPFASLLVFFSQPENFGNLNDDLKVVVFLGALRIIQGDVGDLKLSDWVCEMIKDEGVGKLLLLSGREYVDVLRLEVGRLCAICADRVGAVSTRVAEMVLTVLEWMVGGTESSSHDVDLLSEVIDGTTSNTSTTRNNLNNTGGGQRNAKLRVLRGITPEAFTILCDSLNMMLSTTKEETITTIRGVFTVDQDEDFIPIPTELPDTLVLSLSNISTLLARSRPPATTTAAHSYSHTRTGSLSTLTNQMTDIAMNNGERPTTPKGTKTPDILGTIISPPTALLRSPAATGLTKTYMNNDFRQLRQVPSARLNTSRLPSMHVDDFESGALPGTGAAVPVASVSPLIVPVPIPITDVSAFGGLLNMGQ